MKLLVLLSRVPYPLEKGDKLRAYHQLRYLSQQCELHLVCLNDAGTVEGAQEELSPYCRSLEILPLKRPGILWNMTKALFRAKPLQIGYFYSCQAKRRFQEIVSEVNPDHIYCQLIRTGDYVRDLKIPKTLDYQDVFSVGYRRQAMDAPLLLKPVFRRESRLLKKYEREIFSCFDHHTMISVPDRAQIDHPERERIEVIHNGVDLQYFSSDSSDKEFDLLFTGNMNYPPNVMGAEFLVREILPALKSLGRSPRVLLAGATPSKRVRNLAADDVVVSGWMEDIRSAYRSSRIFVAPMRIGTGLQNKLLEAMAMRMPCLTSALANSALGAEPGKEVVVCQTPEDYAREIIRLMDHPEESAVLADAGHDFVERNYNWETETARLFKLMTASSAAN